MKILLIEDEVELRRSLEDWLREGGHLVESAGSVAEGKERVALYAYDLLVLDVGLPDGSGMEVLRALREARADTGVLILSARDSLDDKVEGLDLGADDYLTKPFHFAELNARLKSIRRRRHAGGLDFIESGKLKLYPDSRECAVDGAVLPLTPKEFDLLLYFVNNTGRVLTRESIAEHLWGDYADAYDDFTFLYTHVKNIRKKIAAADPGQDRIQTVYGIGYKFLPA